MSPWPPSQSSPHLRIAWNSMTAWTSLLAESEPSWSNRLSAVPLLRNAFLGTEQSTHEPLGEHSTLKTHYGPLPELHKAGGSLQTHPWFHDSSEYFSLPPSRPWQPPNTCHLLLRVEGKSSLMHLSLAGLDGTDRHILEAKGCQRQPPHLPKGQLCPEKRTGPTHLARTPGPGTLYVFPCLTLKEHVYTEHMCLLISWP